MTLVGTHFMHATLEMQPFLLNLITFLQEHYSLPNFTHQKTYIGRIGVLNREPISRQKQTKNPFKNQLQDRNLVIMGKFVK